MAKESGIFDSITPVQVITTEEQHPTLNAEEECDINVGETIRVLGGKWKMSILYELVGKTRRFNELRRALPGISQKMLTQQLRELEEDGLVNRNVIPDNPPKVEYSTSSYGETLVPLFDVMFEWGANHRKRKSQSQKLSGNPS
ncbi:DNA-binding HxlR family transcriptional regulator [Paenibacillus rhizosphaerae]|uniref:DNA-binding HxlR family transcriptional regulator n=1 Tax=Paenibacillus rhizosphaerae TaxID=297318 RepID=A0A839U1D3_9BACL|nr:helix-turn-helix domain-containing protein [Paenibacillus rhizosphaerae]MBB3131269.1 DNA-binding HxlR family transcriptional regulator [Paenibacillus rhizosphaerae]